MRPITVIDIARLPDDVEALKRIILEQQEDFARRFEQLSAESQARIESLEQELAWLRRQHFGATSEQLPRAPGQGELFIEACALPLAPEARETIAYERRKSAGRPKLPADLPRTRIEYDLSEAEKAQFECVTRLGEEVSETLDYTPARLSVIEHVRAKYRCESAGEATIRTAAAEPSPIAKSNASAGLLAQVLTAKYCDGLPLARQERIFARQGLAISRQTLCGWTLGSTELLGVLMPVFKRHVLGAPVVFGDDTPLEVLDPGRGATRTARLWAYVSAGELKDAAGQWRSYPRAVIYEFTETREAVHPIGFLKGYAGYLQADDYAGYQALFRTGAIQHVACWAHCRRKFFDVDKPQSTPGLAREALGFIGKLYEIERTVKDDPPDKRGEIRQRDTVPLLEQFRLWLEGHFPKLLSQGKLAEAFGYVLSNWAALVRFTENGILAPDTNLVERSIRPVAVGRKAWLFAGSVRGGEAAATAFSLIETCKLNRVEPYAYLKDVLTRIGSHRADRLAELLPFNWKPLTT